MSLSGQNSFDCIAVQHADGDNSCSGVAGDADIIDKEKATREDITVQEIEFSLTGKEKEVKV